ncbi:uncharacterized protein si:ch211-155e24.3 [Osmerus mordax]|uniref:uncharacterized protein si:ch211-155e24.3 n=1 Tax=Osmerus mordax TaxID=8014 RepID=UPI0035104DA7
MSNCIFQAQLTSVMEILAKAAVAEINRRVDDSCAILRLELTQSQRDIDVLKKKYTLMEGELRRTRGLVRRKDRGTYPVKVVLNKGRNTSQWRCMDTVEEDIQLQSAQAGDVEQNAESEPILIEEEDTWKTDPDPLEKLRISRVESHAKAGQAASSQQRRNDKPTDDSVELYPSAEGPEDPEPALPPTEHFEGYSEPHGSSVTNGGHQRVVKDEGEREEPDEAADIIPSDPYGMDPSDRHLWSSNPDTEPADSDFSFDPTDQYHQSLSMFPSHSGMLSVPSMSEDTGPQLPSKGKRHSKTSRVAHMKRHNRALGEGPRQQTVHIPEEGESSEGVNLIDENGMIVQQQYRAMEATDRGSAGVGGSSLAASAFSGYNRSNFNMARRIRTPWRSGGVGERRFSCTFCGKSFMRFSQLKEHLRSHTGEKPFSCVQCGRSFTKQCNLIRHAVVHSGEKPFECAQCGKCFTQRSSLKSHQRTHIGQSDVSVHRPMVPAYAEDPHTSLMMTQTRCFK